MTELTDEQCDEIRREMAKHGDYATRDCIREIHRLIESGEIKPESWAAADLLLGK